MIYVVYVCEACDTGGSDPETTPGKAVCWNCGADAEVTCRIALP